MAEPILTERQAKWFAAIRASLERDTGKSLAEWVAVARACPETGHRARLKWFKDRHGLLQNRASLVLREAFGSTGWSDPQALIDALWKDGASRTIFEAIDRRALVLPHVLRTARKGYTAWSGKVQFAAARPIRGGATLLGLAVPVEASPRLSPATRLSWSERLTAVVPLSDPVDVDDEIGALLEAARERS